MNVGVITESNEKGQIVIPKKYRDVLGINQNTPLNLRIIGKGVYIEPLEESLGLAQRKKVFIELLRKTQGAWKGDDWEETDKRRKEIEKEASIRRKKQW